MVNINQSIGTYLCLLIINSFFYMFAILKLIQWMCIDVSLLRFNIQCYICTVCFCCIFLFGCWLVSLVMILIYVLTCSLLFMSLALLGLVKTCLVLCILCLSRFLLCLWIAFVDLVAFVCWIFEVLEFCVVSYVMPVTTFCSFFCVFLKVCFYLSELRVSVILGWSICLSLLLSVMMLWILLIVLLASFDPFNISNNWAAFSVECDSLSFESSPTALYNWTITLSWIWFLKRNVERGWEEKTRDFIGPCSNLIGSWLKQKSMIG